MPVSVGNRLLLRKSAILRCACGVLGVRNLKELKERGDTLVEKVGSQGGMRPSQLVPMAYQWLGITRGIDENAPAALMIMRYPNRNSTSCWLSHSTTATRWLRILG
jgi:hypothetical protein